MVKYFRKSLSASELWVSSHERSSDFYVSAWQRGESAVPMLVVRLALGVLALALLVWAVASAPTPYWPIYLTNWGLVLIVAMTTSGIIVSICAMCKIIPEEGPLPWYVSMYWLMYNLAVPMSFLITLLYWVLLFDPDIIDVADSFFWLEVASHAFNSMLVLAEVLAARTPCHFAHIYQPLGLGLWYAVFTVIYYCCGGTDPEGNHYIYDVLDWERPVQTLLLVVGSSVGMLALYAVLWGITWGRDRAAAGLVRTTSHDLPFVPADAIA